MGIVVKNWRYEDGMRDIPEALLNPLGPTTNTRFFDKDLQGWHCRVFGADKDFEKWMKRNMKGKHDCTFRFNSGNPMHSIWIKEDQDATLFKLTWVCGN
ncbi:MAG TPA: hypothetical protein VIY47_02545 [Ignavibacteriaceae bacterium]